MSQGVAIPQETIDEVFKLDRRGTKKTVIARRLGLNRSTIYTILESHVESVGSGLLSPSSEGMENSENPPSGRVGLSEQEIERLPASLQKVAKNCRKFEFIRSVPAFGIDIYRADGDEIRVGTDEDLRAYQDKLKNQKDWYGRTYGGRR